VPGLPDEPSLLAHELDSINRTVSAGTTEHLADMEAPCLGRASGPRVVIPSHGLQHRKMSIDNGCRTVMPQ